MQTNTYGKRIWNSVLLRQIKKARPTHCLNDPLGEFHGPIEDDTGIKPMVREIEHQAEKESLIVGMGCGQNVWGRMLRILKSEHGIV